MSFKFRVTGVQGSLFIEVVKIQAKAHELGIPNNELHIDQSGILNASNPYLEVEVINDDKGKRLFEKLKREAIEYDAR